MLSVLQAKIAAPRVTHVYMCALVCVHVCVINENQHPFQDFCYLISHTLLIYPSDFDYFRHVGLFSSVSMHVGDVATCRVSD